MRSHTEAAEAAPMMSPDELKDLWEELDRLRQLHAEEFEKWWDQANALSEKHFAQLGWLLERKFR